MMIKVLATNNLASYSKQLLKSIYSDCAKIKNQPRAFLSFHTRVNDFLEVTHKKQEHLISDYTAKSNSGNYLNATIALPLKSKLFLDLPDKSLYEKDNKKLDISDIRKMIIPLKYRHQVKDIYIDDFNNVSCKVMGRDQLTPSNSNYETKAIKEREMEYKIALLFYMSRKFELNFNIGMNLKNDIPKPKYVEHMTFGNTYDMVDEFEYIDS